MIEMPLNKNGISFPSRRSLPTKVLHEAMQLADTQNVFSPDDTGLLAKTAAALLCRSGDQTLDETAALSQLSQLTVEQRHMVTLRALEAAAQLSSSEQRIVTLTRRLLLVVPDQLPDPPEDPEYVRDIVQARRAAELATMQLNRARGDSLQPGHGFTVMKKTPAIEEAETILLAARRRVTTIQAKEDRRRAAYHRSIGR